MKIFWLLILVLSSAVAASAQTVGPLLAEGGKGRARGEFVVTNNGVQPMVTTVQAMTFKLSPQGESIFLPLDTNNVVVKLLETSAKIGAKQNHVFAYEVQCMSQQPCLVAMLPRMVTGLHTSEGLQIGIIVPHSIYLCADRAKDCRKRVRLAAGVPAGQ